jgi:predicted Zn-dependent protease
MLAIALARSGDARFWPRADALLETLLARNPLDQLLLGTRLDLAKARNDAPLADALSRRVDDPGIQADRFCRQALDAFNHGQPREARKALDAALVLDPDHAESRYLLGLVEALLHHPRQAAEAFAHYLRVAPEGPHAAAARAWLNKNPRHGTV